MSIQTIIIEDEEKSLHVISDLIQQFAVDLELIGSSGNVSKSVDLILARGPQLVFMDIQIADGTGFDVLQKLAFRNFELIFVTAHDCYAIEAFRASAIDYLLKPIDITEFEEAVGRARIRINERKRNEHIDHLLNMLTGHSNQEKKIGIATVNSHEFIDLKDIMWCNSEGGYTTFHLINETKLISSRNLGFYEDLLCSNNFCRIHNTSIVNIRFIKSYIKGKSGYLVLTNGARLEISQRRKADFLSRF